MTADDIPGGDMTRDELLAALADARRLLDEARGVQIGNPPVAVMAARYNWLLLLGWMAAHSQGEYDPAWLPHMMGTIARAANPAWRID